MNIYSKRDNNHFEEIYKGIKPIEINNKKMIEHVFLNIDTELFKFFLEKLKSGEKTRWNK